MPKQKLKAKIYVNRHLVQANKKQTAMTGQLVDEPVISINTSLGVIYCKTIEFTEGAVLQQDASSAICSGATILIQTTFESLIIDGDRACRSMFDDPSRSYQSVKDSIKNA